MATRRERTAVRVEGTEAPDWGTAVAAPRHEARRASMGACGKHARGTRKARHPHAGRAPTTVTTRLSRVIPRLTGGGHRPLGVGGATRRGGDATNSNLWCVWWWVEGPNRPLRGTQWRCAAVLACATARDRSVARALSCNSPVSYSSSQYSTRRGITAGGGSTWCVRLRSQEGFEQNSPL